jgi:DNA excision repair protein ERCC-3
MQEVGGSIPLTSTRAFSMYSDHNKPLIVQSDRSLLLEVNNPSFEAARDSLLRFADLEKSPEYIHTYRLTPVSLWNAASSGMVYEDIMGELTRFAKYEIPKNIAVQIRQWLLRYGRLTLLRKGEYLCLESDNPALFLEVVEHKKIRRYVHRVESSSHAVLLEWSRGQIKKECIDLGYPVIDRAGYAHGEPLPFSPDRELTLRKYQEDAVGVFLNYERTGGSGIIVLPCGSGKTVVGIGVMARICETTLILVTNITAARQWKQELMRKTTLGEEQIGEYSGEAKQIRQVTVATYQILTYRKRVEEDFLHLSVLNRENWGLIIYDEVHLLPAPVFRFASEVQGRRRLGLTATLIREDGKERDVFSLIGPKIFDVPWKVLEKQGWISQAFCTEIRCDLPEEEQYTYALENRRERFKRASVNRKKYEVVKYLLRAHRNDSILVIGQYIKQLEHIADELTVPIITGKTKNTERDVLYERFRKGEIKTLIVSKVANFAVDLPDANVAIQISGTFGSRQEEAQRLGRILRPKKKVKAHFYSVVTRNTEEDQYAEKRQLFLTEQGYSYEIVDEKNLEDKIPHDRIWQDKIPHDRIRQDRSPL